MEPLVAVVAERDRPRAHRRPNPAPDRLQTQTVLVFGPDLDRPVRMRGRRLRDRFVQLFLSASRSSDVAARGWRGRGVWTDHSSRFSASQPRWGHLVARIRPVAPELGRSSRTPPLPDPRMPSVPFKLNQDRRHHIPKQKHKVTNWREYDAGLRQRGSLTVWFTDEAIEAWQAEPRTTRGGQPDYSALAILTALTLRAVFRLAFRQTEGLIGSVIGLLGLDLAVPDHTTLCRRAETLEVPRPRPRSDGEPVHLLVDSTGLKLCGAGEWLIEKHGTRTRRSWRKLHLGMDADTGRIVAAALTDQRCR